MSEDAEICPACNGSGEGMHDGSVCRTCGGRGEIFVGIEKDDWPYAEGLNLIPEWGMLEQ